MHTLLSLSDKSSIRYFLFGRPGGTWFASLGNDFRVGGRIRPRLGLDLSHDVRPNLAVFDEGVGDARPVEHLSCGLGHSGEDPPDFTSVFGLAVRATPIGDA